ncbi:enteropeptidase-like [Hyperolius riggenbachi]|uniref:enteropeptidase-like n=1 Tax=Hyperolius riggenbachi TaxID=752182 RepID=UPI0035A34652
MVEGVYLDEEEELESSPSNLIRMGKFMLPCLRKDPHIKIMKDMDLYWVATLLEPRNVISATCGGSIHTLLREVSMNGISNNSATCRMRPDNATCDSIKVNTKQGSFKIVSGATYTLTLQDSNSADFKLLAFDMQKMINDIFQASELKLQYKASKILEFRNGSVITDFTVQFIQDLPSDRIQSELINGIKGNYSELSNQFKVDILSVVITDALPPTTESPTSTTPSPTTTNRRTSSTGQCPPYQKICNDGITCIQQSLFCDGMSDCPDSSDEDTKTCASPCDGQFLLTEDSGTFHSQNYPHPYEPNLFCRWIISVKKGFNIKINFPFFETQNYADILFIYEGIGPNRILRESLEGTNPSTVRIFSNQAMVEFETGYASYGHLGFQATYTIFTTNSVSNREKIECDFEDGFCYWSQDVNDDEEWMRVSGPYHPPTSGPDFDHTFGNETVRGRTIFGSAQAPSDFQSQPKQQIVMAVMVLEQGEGERNGKAI